jgi:hypothetical protein
MDAACLSPDRSGGLNKNLRRELAASGISFDNVQLPPTLGNHCGVGSAVSRVFLTISRGVNGSR